MKNTRWLKPPLFRNVPAKSSAWMTRLLALLSAWFCPLSPAWAQCTPSTPCASTLINLGTLGGGTYGDWGNLSGDGSTAVGYSVTGGGQTHAFRWAGGVMSDLGTLGGAQSYAYGISGTGLVVVGYSITPGGDPHAFRWVNGVMSDLGTLGNAMGGSFAIGSNSDGSVVVGLSQTQNNETHAFRWTGGVMSDLGTLGGPFSAAYATNADGSVVVGLSSTVGGNNHAFRWIGGLMSDLGTLGGNSSIAYATNRDGSVVVGQSAVAGNVTHAFRWAGGVMADLGVLGGDFSIARATNADGSVVVGDSCINNACSDIHAIRWTAGTGMRDLNTLLTTAGVNMNGVTLFSATGVSSNGQIIISNGTISGADRVFIVRYYDGTPAEEPIGGVTTAASVQQSLNGLADNRFGVAAHQHGLVVPLLGSDQPIQNDNHMGTFVSFGSLTAGGTIRHSFGSGLSMIGGLAYAKETYPDAELTRSAAVAGAARYVFGRGSLAPYVEAGGWYAPNASLSFSRTYDNGAGTGTGVGTTSGTLSYAFTKVGVLLDGGLQSQFGVAAELGRQWLSTSSYIEAFTAQNPFNAAVSEGTDATDLFKVKGQWTFRFDSRLDMTLWGGAVHGFNRTTDVSATVAGVGTLMPTSLSSMTWAEYGARVGYKLSNTLALDFFANGVAGPQSIGTQTHAGVGLRVAY